MHTIITWVGLLAIVATVAAVLVSPWIGRGRSALAHDSVVGRTVLFQAFLGLVLFFAFPFSYDASERRATWILVTGPATVLLWLSALGHAVWFTWRKARRREE